MDLPIKVPLKRPIKHDGNTIEVLQFDEPDLGAQIDYADLEEELSDPPTEKDAVRVNLFWLARLSGQSEDVIRKVKGSDISAVNDAVDAVMQMVSKNGTGDTAGNEPPAK